MPVDVVFVDVGQGDCTLLYFYARPSTPGKTTVPPAGGRLVMIDCGSTSGWRTFSGKLAKPGLAGRRAAGKAVIDYYLAKAGNQIEYLVITHPDQDHYNEIATVLSDKVNAMGRIETKDCPIDDLKCDIKNVIFSGTANEYNASYTKKKDAANRARSFEYLLLQHIEKDAKLAAGTLLPTDWKCTPTRTIPRRLHDGTFTGFEQIFPPKGVPNDYDATLTLLAVNAVRLPGKKASSAKVANMNSVVLLLQVAPTVSTSSHRVFLTGDATKETETLILDTKVRKLPTGPETELKSAGLLNNTYRTTLKMGHHGSETSSCAEWLNTLTPDGLLISAANHNYHMPKMKFLDKCLTESGLGTFADLGKTSAKDIDKHTIVVYQETKKAYDPTTGVCRTVCTTANKATKEKIKLSKAKTRTKTFLTGTHWYWRLGRTSAGGVEISTTKFNTT